VWVLRGAHPEKGVTEFKQIGSKLANKNEIPSGTKFLANPWFLQTSSMKSFATL